MLAEAANLLAVSRSNEMHWMLIGERHSTKPESIEFERHVLERFRTAGLGDRLHRLGYRDDVAWIMNEVDLLVHPARQEPLGRVLLEAAAAGLPIVATTVGGTEEILRDGESARLVPPDDPHSLAAAIIELHDDPHKRSRFAAAARARIETAFTIQQAADRLAAAWKG
ncbi:MAG: glycosyltransferase family 4 protein [Planctomycetaceae bacterium]